MQVAGLQGEAGMICQFRCGGMSADAVFDQLEEFALRYEEEGLVTDIVNGAEYSAQ